MTKAEAGWDKIKEVEVAIKIVDLVRAINNSKGILSVRAFEKNESVYLLFSLADGSQWSMHSDIQYYDCFAQPWVSEVESVEEACHSYR